MLALPALFALAALLVAFGLLYSGKAVSDSLVWIIHKTTGRIPIIGGILSAPAAHALQKLSNTLGHFADGVAGDITASWHYLAVIVDRVGWTIFHLSLAVERLTWQITVGYPLHLLWQRAQDAYRLASRASHSAAHALGDTTVINRYYRNPTKSALRKAFDTLIQPLHKELTQFERWTRHAIAEASGDVYNVTVKPVRVGYTAKQLRRLGRRVSALEAEIAGVTSVALVATALRAMKLSFLRCDSFRRIGNKLGCHGFGIIEELLAPAVEALVIIDLCRFALAAQKLARVIVPELGVLLLVQDAVCLGGGASLPSAHDSPDTLTTITLPSASG